MRRRRRTRALAAVVVVGGGGRSRWPRCGRGRRAAALLAPAAPRARLRRAGGAGGGEPRQRRRSERLPRHHVVSGHRLRRRRVRGLRLVVRHSRSEESRSASRRLPIRTCPSGTRRRSATTAPSCSSPTSGAAAARRVAASTDKMEWGGNAIFTLEDGQLQFKSYYKMPAPQTNDEICTAHNGNLIPVPGRDIMVQAFYHGRRHDVRLDRSRRTRSRSDSSIAVRAAATGPRTGTTASSSRPTSSAAWTSTS